MAFANSTKLLSYVRCRHEAKVVEEIVGKILDKLTSTYSIVHKDFVGINSRMEEDRKSVV